jgi:hypothetical protein
MIWQTIADLAADPNPERTELGADMAEQILAAAAPIMQGKPSDLVVEVMGAVLISVLMIACPAMADQQSMLRRYADVLELVAENLEG